jgi:hypothetical protein
MSLRLNGQPLKVLTEDLEADIIGEYDVRTWSDIMCICGRWIQLSQQKPCLQRMLRYVDQIPNQTSCCSFHHAICKYERERESRESSSKDNEQETSKDGKPVSHTDHRQLVLDREIALLLSSEPPHGGLAIIEQIAENIGEALALFKCTASHNSYQIM